MDEVGKGMCHKCSAWAILPESVPPKAKVREKGTTKEEAKGMEASRVSGRVTMEERMVPRVMEKVNMD